MRGRGNINLPEKSTSTNMFFPLPSLTKSKMGVPFCTSLSIATLKVILATRCDYVL